MMTPLCDLRVVELSAFIAAPLGGMTLAQLGADVIRIDPIGGNIDYGRWPLSSGGSSLYWAGLNKSKRSIALALETAEGRSIAQALITAPGPSAGILLTNLPATGWSDHSVLTTRRPDLITLRLLGKRDGSSAVDYTVNCASGFPFITGATEEPTNHVLPAWDIAAGLYLATGLLAAERHRLRTGQGQEITIALADVMLATLGNLGYLSDVELNKTERVPLGNALYGAFGADFATADARRVMVVALTRRQWRNIVSATGLSGEFRSLRPWIASRSLDELRTVFDHHRVLWGPYQNVGQLMKEDPWCSLENPMFQCIDQPGIGPHLMPGSPLFFSGIRRDDVHPAPQLGQHTDELLRDIVGCSAAEIRRLRDEEIVA
jgi:2-methylfumaryl-CoA isomerase